MKATSEQSAEATMHWEDPKGVAQSVRLNKVQTIVGRSLDCDIILRDPHLSRIHALVIGASGEFYLIDVGSTHGTFVNGQSIQLYVLHDGDRIQFGKSDIEMRFRRSDASSIAGFDHSRIATPVHLKLSDLAERRRLLEQEMLLAEETQAALLPSHLPKVPGFRLSAYSRPTRFVGGDFYDFLQFNSRLYGMLGDVSGKGVAASLLSSMALGCLQAHLRSSRSLAETIGELNLLMLDKPTQQFITLFLFYLDSTGRGEFASAGHNPAFIYRQASGGIEALESNSTIIGVFQSVPFYSNPIELLERDVMLVYSDGLTEAEDASGQILGETAVLETLRRTASKGAKSLRLELLKLIQAFTVGRNQSDDITFSIVERNSAAFTDASTQESPLEESDTAITRTRHF